MKRLQPSFVVEHKRRPRFVHDQPKDLRSGRVGRELRDLIQAVAEPQQDRDERTEAATKTRQDPSVSKNVLPKRILEAHAHLPIAVASDTTTNTGNTKRQGRPRKAAKTDQNPLQDDQQPMLKHQLIDFAGLSEPTEEITVPQLAGEEIAITASSQESSSRLSERLKRRSARKALPLGERWRWNMKF